MDWYGLFSSLDGRIGRRAFWLGFVVILAGLALAETLARRLGGVGPVLLLLIAYPAIAVLVKRLHDRGRSGWWALLVAAPLAVGAVGGLAARAAGMGEAMIVRAATMGVGVGYAVLAALIVVELGLRRGKPGYSEHGPPPLM